MAVALEYGDFAEYFMLGRRNEPMTSPLSEHEAQVLHLLSMFQMLELSIKIYLAGAYKTIRTAVKDSLPFHYGYKDIENFPLERLLGLFSKLNDNKGLQSRLNKLLPKRNLVAHRALVYRHDEIADLLDIDKAELLDDLKIVEVELNECLLLVSSELHDLLGRESGKTGA